MILNVLSGVEEGEAEGVSDGEALGSGEIGDTDVLGIEVGLGDEVGDGEAENVGSGSGLGKLDTDGDGLGATGRVYVGDGVGSAGLHCHGSVEFHGPFIQSTCTMTQLAVEGTVIFVEHGRP